MHKACEHGHEEIVKLLLAREDTNVLIRNKVFVFDYYASIFFLYSCLTFPGRLKRPLRILQRKRIFQILWSFLRFFFWVSFDFLFFVIHFFFFQDPMKIQQERKLKEEERIRLEEEERRNFGKLKFRKLDYWKTKNITAH